MEDASLDDFLDGGDAQEVEDGGGDDGGTSEEDDERADADGDGGDDPDRSRPADGEHGAADQPASAVDPATATYAWTPGGEPCAACGDRVERRWHSPAGLVCPDCKEW